MKERLGDVELFNRLSGKFEPATVYRGMDESNFRDFETLWRPELTRRLAEFASWDEAAKGNVQDEHWDWVGKAKADGIYDAFAVECDGTTQGLMLVDLATHFARLPSQNGLDLCYIELVATAPWNRVHFSERPKYKGTGRVLLATAVSLSFQLEFKGRLGLHSLPESLTWYEPNGFTDVGFDDAKKLQYFELSEASAQAYFTLREEE